MSYQKPTSMPEGSYPNHSTAAAYNQPATQSITHREAQGQATSYPQPVSQSTQGDAGLSAMINNFSQTHLGVANAGLPGTAIPVSAGQYPINASQLFYTQEGHLVYVPAVTHGIYAPQPLGATSVSDGTYGGYATTLQLPAQAPYQGYVPNFSILPYSPGRAGYYSDRSDVMHKDVPGLDNRRGSYSTNESAPGTPYYGGSFNQRDHSTHIAVADRSPIYSTPSPQQVPMLQGKPIPHKGLSLNIDLDGLIQQHPAIPKAVPAVFTPHDQMKSLDQSLANPIYGNRNVYIRGLHPDTDDETLAAYAARFGSVETSKAIIDTATGACKGFGFAKYFDVHDSELCIRGFYKLGYEVGFARESFNSRLKANGDEDSTNLYVSNLPKDMTESELGAIFMDYTVSSSRILRDERGNSRGVGFARFETRDICEEIIKKFHGQPIGEDGLVLQVRYADTPAQKDLKRITTERRQFRTTEYNVGAYGGDAADIMALSPTFHSPVLPRVAQIARHLPHSKTTGSWKRNFSGLSSNDSRGGVSFKDIDTSSVESAPVKQVEIAEPQDEVKTPTVSEDGSGDEDTIQCLSPAVGHGDSTALATGKRP